MLERIALYISIFFSSAFKFISGPLIGVAANLSVMETAVMTALGMMLSISLFTLFGSQMRRIISRFRRKKKKKFSKRNRRFVRIWSRYGLPGTAFLTPLLLTPIGGAILANAFRNPPGRILSYMSLSAFFWGFVLTILLKYAKGLIF